MPDRAEAIERAICDFCGCAQSEAFLLLSGPGCMICDACVAVASSFIAAHRGAVDGEAEYLSWRRAGQQREARDGE